MITGMTRDGTFRIRDGKIAEPLVNLRFTVSVPELLADVPGLTRETSARQRRRLLRRALPVRRARPGDRDRAASTSPGSAARARASSRLSRWKSTIVFAKKSTATTTVRRVRLRSTMCVPPCEAGVKPIPPKPVSRPECIRIKPDERDREQHVHDCEELKHRPPE